MLHPVPFDGPGHQVTIPPGLKTGHSRESGQAQRIAAVGRAKIDLEVVASIAVQGAIGPTHATPVKPGGSVAGVTAPGRPVVVGRVKIAVFFRVEGKSNRHLVLIADALGAQGLGFGS